MTYQLPLVIEEGARHNELFKYACSLQARGLEDNEITENLLKASNENCNPPYPKNETIGIIKSVTNQYPKGEKYTEKGKDNNKASYPIKNNSKEPTGANMEPKEVEEDYSDKEKYRWEKSGPYIYKDKKGSPIFSKTKWEVFERKNNKRVDKFFPYYDFINKHKDLNKLNKKEKSLIYCLDKVEKAKENNETIYLVEGEKDADNLQKMGLVATCFKSSTEKFNKYYKDQFNGIDTIYIIPDFDETGIKSLLQRVKELKKIVKNIYVFRWYPSTKLAYDITDLIDEKNLGKDKLVRVFEDSKEKEIPDYYYLLIDEKMRINSLQELYERLEKVGNNWRQEHKEEDKKAPKIPANIIAKMLYENCFISFLKTEYNKKNASIIIYNPSEGFYQIDYELINVLMNCLESNIKQTKQNEVLNQLKILLKRKNQYRLISRDINYVIFKNGIYNKRHESLEPHTPRRVFLYKIPHNYNPNIKYKTFDGWDFDDWLNIDISKEKPDKIGLMWQVFSTIIQPNILNKKAFFICDEKSDTGKSTLIKLMTYLVGIENTSPLNLVDIEDRFPIFTAENKLLIAGYDNDRDDKIPKNKNFKRIVSGDEIFIETKGVQGHNAKFNATIVQAMNGIPKYGFIDQGLLNRIRFIVLDKQYKGKEKNPRVINEYIKDEELMEYIIYNALKIDPTDIIDTEESQELVKSLESFNDNVSGFLSECLEEFKSDRIPTKFLYQMFTVWSESTGNYKNKVNRKQFTNKSSEYMESRGWQYKKNMRINKDFKVHDDIKIINDMISTNIKSNKFETTEGIHKFYAEKIKNPKSSGEPVFVRVKEN